jgi:O-antigen/teichoic acid export membrane protein
MIVGGIEIGMPFVRIFALTRLLSLREIGFVSLLTAFLTFLELSTDISVFRFVYSAPKERFEEALASAHALAIARGLVVCVVALGAAPFVAASMSLVDYWMSFAAMAPIILIHSLENYSVRLAEKDFRYWPQVKSTGISVSISLVVLVIVASITRNHIAIIASYYALYISMFFTSRLFADSRYRVNFTSPMFKAAFRFGYPLVFNGFGLSMSQTADRFVVAGLFDLQTLAVYSVVMLAVNVPLNIATRVLGTTLLARFYHANSVQAWLNREVRAASSFVAASGALYAGAVIFLAGPVIALVFGQKFHAGQLAMIFLGATAYMRYARMEPFTEVMLNAGRTKRLAASNLLASSYLIFMVAFSFFNRSINAVLGARLLGELTSLIATFYIARRGPEAGRYAYTISTVVGLAFVVAASALALVLERSGVSLPLLVGACVAYALLALAWAAIDIRGQMRQLRDIWEPTSGGPPPPTAASPPTDIIS